MKTTSLIFFILTFTISSCTTVNLLARKGKDLQLSASDIEKFNGVYLNVPTDTSNFRRTLYCNFTRNKKDTLCRQKQYSVKVVSVDPKTLTLNLNENETVIQSLMLKGKYKKGYFKVRRQFLIEGVVGPLVWVFGEHINYLGLSKDNNLVVFDSGGTGVLFIVALPIFVAGGDRHNYEYLRTK